MVPAKTGVYDSSRGETVKPHWDSCHADGEESRGAKASREA
jgi:hypothetical protein